MIYNLVYDHFRQFVVRNLKQYPQELPVGFVGSIAYYYKDVLEKVLNDNGIRLANILQDPIDGLREYHKKDLTPA